MRQQVASDPKDRETWTIMEELAEAPEEERLTYKKLADRHGLTEAQLYKRMERLREKYLERYERWRNGMVLAWIRWGAAAVVAAIVIAWAAWWARSPVDRPEIRRDPDELRPAPSASASSDTPFEPALPTEPPPPAPRAPPKPPAPRLKP